LRRFSSEWIDLSVACDRVCDGAPWRRHCCAPGIDATVRYRHYLYHCRVYHPHRRPYNLLLLAIPMYLLYELGIILARFVPKRRTADEQAAAPSAG
jgi:hypothetical protein